MKNKNQTIHLGYTFDFFGPAVMLIVGGGVCFLVHYLLAVCLIVIGTILLLLQTGIETDADKKSVRKYYQFFFIRTGSWDPATHYTTVTLSMTNEMQTVAHQSGSTDFYTKTYDVSISNPHYSKELNDFKSYDKAKEALHLVEKTLQLQAVDKIEELRELAFKRRAERHRK